MANLAVVQAISELGIGPKAALILEAHFDNPNMNQTKLSELLGISQSRVSAVLRHPRVRKAFPGISRKRLLSALPKATDKYLKLMDQTENLEVSRKVTEAILKNEKVIDNTQNFVVKNQIELLRPEELKELINRASAIELPSVDYEIVEDQPEEPNAQ